LKEKLQLGPLFAGRLQELLDRGNLSNSDLAKAVNLSHVSVGNFLDGQLPKSEHLAALAEYFGVTTDWLLGREGESRSALVMQERPPSYVVDDVLESFNSLKEQVASLERVLKQLKQADSSSKGNQGALRAAKVAADQAKNRGR